MTAPAPVPSDPAAAWTELHAELLSWHSGAGEIADGIEAEGGDPAAARATADAFSAALGYMDHLAAR